MQLHSLWMRGIMLVLGIWLAAPATVQACSIRVVRQPWYAISATLSAPALPAGVSIEEVGDGDGGFSQLQIRNSSATPLYLIGNTKADQIEPLPQDFGAGRGATHKLVANEVWVWERGFREGPSVYGWRWQSHPELNDSITLYVQPDEISATYAVVATIDGNSTEPGRPAEPAPGPLRLEIPLVYGDQLIMLPIEITYAINPNYNPAPIDPGLLRDACPDDFGSGRRVTIGEGGKLVLPDAIAEVLAATASPGAAGAAPQAAPTDEPTRPAPTPPPPAPAADPQTGGPAPLLPIALTVAGMLAVGAIALWRRSQGRA